MIPYTMNPSFLLNAYIMVDYLLCFGCLDAHAFSYRSLVEKPPLYKKSYRSNHTVKHCLATNLLFTVSCSVSVVTVLSVIYVATLRKRTQKKWHRSRKKQTCLHVCLRTA